MCAGLGDCLWALESQEGDQPPWFAQDEELDVSCYNGDLPGQTGQVGHPELESWVPLFPKHCDLVTVTQLECDLGLTE